MIAKLFDSEVAIKVFYAYVAVTMGATGIDVADKIRPDVLADRVVQLDKRLERIENVIISVVKPQS